MSVKTELADAIDKLVERVHEIEGLAANERIRVHEALDAAKSAVLSMLEPAEKKSPAKTKE